MEIRTQVFLGSWLDDHYEVWLNSGIYYVCRKIIYSLYQVTLMWGFSTFNLFVWPVDIWSDSYRHQQMAALLSLWGEKQNFVHSVTFIATSMQRIASFINLRNRLIKHFFIWRAGDNTFISNAMTFIEGNFLNTTYIQVHRKVSIREFTQKPFRPQNYPIFWCTSSKQERRQR